MSTENGPSHRQSSVNWIPSLSWPYCHRAWISVRDELKSNSNYLELKRKCQIAEHINPEHLEIFWDTKKAYRINNHFKERHCERGRGGGHRMETKIERNSQPNWKCQLNWFFIGIKCLWKNVKTSQSFLLLRCTSIVLNVITANGQLIIALDDASTDGKSIQYVSINKRCRKPF